MSVSEHFFIFEMLMQLFFFSLRFSSLIACFVSFKTVHKYKRKMRRMPVLSFNVQAHNDNGNETMDNSKP